MWKSNKINDLTIKKIAKSNKNFRKAWVFIFKRISSCKSFIIYLQLSRNN